MDDAALVFVPGLNCTPALFAPQLAAIGAGRLTQCVDHTRDDSVAAIAARFLADAPRRFALAGLSLGGYVAFEIVRQAPERVTRLALLDTRASGDTPEDKERRQRLIAFAEQGRFEDVHGVLWPRLVHPDRLSDKPLEGVVKGMMAATGPEAFMRQQTAVIGRSDYQAMLSAITVPTVIIVGENDLITPPNYARAMAEAITGAHLVTIPSCGHLSSLEQPDIVNAALADWLKR
ncbi:MAG: alpha/beta fold hydrolase [Beijerinckiaceae bacterium]